MHSELDNLIIWSKAPYRLAPKDEHNQPRKKLKSRKLETKNPIPNDRSNLMLVFDKYPQDLP
jgi:hypothetical protein